MNTITGTITHEPKRLGTHYTLSIVAENGTQYLLTVNEWTKNNMVLKRGRTLRATGPIYANPTTGIAEINPEKLSVLPKRCPTSYPKRKRSPQRKKPSRKQCARPTQSTFAI